VRSDLLTIAARRRVSVVFLVLLLVTLGLVGQVFFYFFNALVLALVVVSLTSPAERWLRARVHSPVMSMVVTTTGIVLLVLVPLAVFGVTLSGELLRAVALIQEGAIARDVSGLLSGEGAVADAIRNRLAGVGLRYSPTELAAILDGVVRAVVVELSSWLRVVALDAVDLVVHFSMMVVAIGALYLDGSRLRAFLLDLAPLPDDEVELIIGRFTAMARAVFLGNGTAAALQGLCGGLAIAFFDVGSGILWGAVIAVLAFLPIVGASLVVVPAALIIALRDGVGTALGFLVLNGAYILVFEYWLNERLIGNRAQLPAVLVLFGVVGGLALWGPIGLFLGPFLITALLALVELWRDHYRARFFGPRPLKGAVGTVADEPVSEDAVVDAAAPDAPAPASPASPSSSS
jgi:predicted PurR-regulated permease PerM